MLIVVEYDEDIICYVDYIVDIGLKVGIYGGEIVCQGDFQILLKN